MNMNEQDREEGWGGRPVVLNMNDRNREPKGGDGPLVPTRGDALPNPLPDLDW